MSDTTGAIILATILVLLLGPILVVMCIDAVSAAAEMWVDLWYRLRGKGER